MKSAALLSLAAILLTACVTDVQADGPAPSEFSFDRPKGSTVETLYAVAVTRDGIRLRTTSNGCTTKANFYPVVLPDVAGSLAGSKSLLLYRTKADTCQSFAVGSAWIDYSYAELGLSPTGKISIDNPLTAWTGPGE
jgi:hypothetical protein